jgi:hypothetical protein
MKRILQQLPPAALQQLAAQVGGSGEPQFWSPKLPGVYWPKPPAGATIVLEGDPPHAAYVEVNHALPAQPRRR